MALPALLLPLLFSAAGVGANMIGARKADRAQAGVMAANRIRQKGLDERASGINEKARGRYEDFEGQQGDRAAELTDMLTTRPDDEAPDLGLPASSSNITVSHGARKADEAKEFTDQQAEAKARLMSLSDLFGDIDTSFARDALDINEVDSFKRGWLGVMPTELDAAATKGAGWRTAGDVLGGIGSVATLGALSGAQFPGMAGLFGGSRPLAGTHMLAQNQPPGGIARLFGGPR